MSLDKDTCRRCGYRWTNDELETIAHLRSHPDIMADPQKVIDLERWERNHRRHLAYMAEWLKCR